MPSKRKATDEDIEDITIDEAPTSIDPYAVLSLTKGATRDEIKSAYRKAALKHHPDKVSPEHKEAANIRFQELAFAYAILSDGRRRRRYDTTGRTEESLDLEDDDFDWSTFYREQYANVVTAETIERFAGEYKGSEEERGHLLSAYEASEGNMDGVYARVMLSDVLVDEERFRGIIDAAITEGEVEGYKKYTLESEKSRQGRVERARKKQVRDAKEAEIAAQGLDEEDDDEQEKGGEAKAKPKKANKTKAKANGSTADLAALIQQRQQGRAENFFDRLEEKYAPKGNGKKGGKRAMEEPSEEAFAKNKKSKK